MPFKEPAPDAPLFVVHNAAAGRDDAGQARAAIEQTLTASRRVFRIVDVADARQLRALAEQTVGRAQAVGGIVVASGGDGTLNSVAQAVLGSGCAFGALPQGTFNLFGRVHGIPADAAEATRALLGARVRPVQVGLVNDRVFLVNATLGLYPDLLEDREGWKARLGRSRAVAFTAGLSSLLRHRRALRLVLEEDGEPARLLRASTLFIGNNRLQLERLGIEEAARVDHGRLVGVRLEPVGLLAKLGLVLRGAFGTLGDAGPVQSFDFARLTVRPTAGIGRRAMAKLSTDGEVVWLRAPLEFRVSPEPLYLLAPQAPAQPEADAAQPEADAAQREADAAQGAADPAPAAQPATAERRPAAAAP